MLETKDYLEIGKLCLSDDMPKNSESFFIAKCVQKVKQGYPNIRLLYSWADGIIGKPGYVYQASNFYYGGFIWTEMYLDKDGNRIHPRTMQGISNGPRVGKMKSRSYDVTQSLGYTKYFGKQFRYVYPLCKKSEWIEIQNSSPMIWVRGDYPKKVDCFYKIQTIKGHHEFCELPYINSNSNKNDMIKNSFL